MKLADSALPGLFRAADKASLEAQRRFLMASRLRLGFLVAAATAGHFRCTHAAVSILRLSSRFSLWSGQSSLRFGY
jgi:hypothetical protein